MPTRIRYNPSVRVLVGAAVVVLLACPGSPPSDAGVGGGAGGLGGGTGGGTAAVAFGDGGFTCDAPIEVDLRPPDGGAVVFSELLVSAMDEAGRGVVAWSGNNTVEALRISTAGVLGAPELVAPDAGWRGVPSALVAAANADGLLLAWTAENRQSISVSRATGLGWSTRIAVNTSPNQAYGLQAALALDGGITLSWEIQQLQAQPWLARESGGTWATTALTPGFTTSGSEEEEEETGKPGAPA